MQIPLELVLQVALNLGTLIAIYVRLETKMAVLQVEIAYIKSALKIAGRAPNEG